MIVSCFVLNSIFVSTIFAENEKEQSDTTTSETTEQYIPILNHFTIRGRPTKSGFDFEGDDNVTNIYNWTEPDQQVRIQWNIINDYNYSATVTVWFRIAEWQYWLSRGLGVIPAFLWFYDRGTVETPDYKLLGNSDFPKFFKYTFTMNPNNHTTNSLVVNLHFENWLGNNQTIQVFSRVFCPQNLINPPSTGGLNIIVP
jgi:hypothetical protein